MSDLRSALGLQLEDVRAKCGRLTPEVVVEAARPEDHPLHSRFQWNDAIAGERWRQEQAAQLIRSYKVTYTTTEDGPQRIRGYMAIRDEDSPRAEYLPTEDVVTDPLTLKLLERELRREIAVLKTKYGHLEAFAAIVNSVVEAA